MDKAWIVAVLLVLAGCSGFPQQPVTNGSVCHWGEVSYDCDTGRFR
jgi:hypothetical protein